MKYLLDTNVCIKYLNGSSESVKKHIEKIDPSEIVICSVLKYELFAGAYKSKNKGKTLDKLKIFFSPLKSLSFNDEAAKHTAKFVTIKLTLACTAHGAGQHRDYLL